MAALLPLAGEDLAQIPSPCRPVQESMKGTNNMRSGTLLVLGLMVAGWAWADDIPDLHKTPGSVSRGFIQDKDLLHKMGQGRAARDSNHEETGFRSLRIYRQ